MKRAPLRRKTPLARGTTQLKQTRRGWNSTLRPMSSAKKKEKADTDPLRAAYVQAAGGVCEVCGATRQKLDCHEIAAGNGRHKAVHDANCLLALCRTCHAEMQGENFRTQLVAKCRACANAINRAKGRNILTLVGVQCAEDSNEAKGF